MQDTGAPETTMAMSHGIWSKLAKEWKPDKLEYLAVDRKLEQLDPEIDLILVGGQRGRVVVDLQ